MQKTEQRYWRYNCSGLLFVQSFRSNYNEVGKRLPTHCFSSLLPCNAYGTNPVFFL